MAGSAGKAYQAWLDSQPTGTLAPLYLPPPINWTTPMPMSTFDITAGLEPIYGLPEDWDYKTATLGPQKQALPQGAIGWTPHGDPYYGSGLLGWMNGFWNKLVNPDPDANKDDLLTEASSSAKQAVSVWQDPDLGFGSKLLGSVGGFLGAAGSAIEAFGAVGGDEDKEEGLFDVAEDVSSFGVRLVSGVVGGLFQLLEGVAELTEQTLFGLPEGFKEVAGMQWDIPDIPVDLPWDAQAWFPELIEDIIDVFAMPIYAIGAFVAPGSLEEKGEVLAAHFQAGRIAYSNMIDPLLSEEYMRRWRGGEDAKLLAMELGNPLAELAGEIIFDPLNFIGKITKPLRAARRIGRAEGTGTTIASTKLHKAIKTSKAADEAGAGQALGKIVDATIETSNDIRKITQEDFAKVGLTSLTQKAKRFAVLDMLGEQFGHIAVAAKQSGSATWMDDSIDTLQGLIKMVSGDKTTVAEGLAILKKSTLPLNVLMSRDSFRLGHVLANMFSDGKKFNKTLLIDRFQDHIKFADDFADLLKVGNKAKIAAFIKDIPNKEMKAYLKGVMETAEKLQGKATGVAGAVEKAFFSTAGDVEGIRDMLKVQGLYDLLKTNVHKTVDNMIPTLSEKLAAGEKLGVSGRAFLLFENFKGSKPIRWVDTFFANVYMGLSPSYIMRNLMVDRLTVFLDTGKAFRRGVPMSKTQMFDKTVRQLGGVRLPAVDKAIGQVGVDLSTFGLLGAARDVERNSGILLVYRFVDDTMKKMVTFGDEGAAMSMKILRDAGMDADVYKNIPLMLINNDYDVLKTMQEFRGMLKNGFIDEFQTGAWMSNEFTKAVNKYDLVDEMEDIRNAETLEDAMSAATDAKRAFASRAKNTVPNPTNPKGAEVAAGDFGTFDNVPNDMMILRHTQRDANIAAETERLEVLNRALALVDDPEQLKIFQEQYAQIASKHIKEFDILTAQAANAQQGFTNLKKADQSVKDAYWLSYWQRQSARGVTKRQGLENSVRGFVEEIEKFLGKGTVQAMNEWKYSDKLMKAAEDYDGIIKIGREYFSLDPKANILRNNILELGSQNGIRLKGKGGRTFDTHLMNTLKNKEYLEAAGVTLPKGFKHYTQMDYDDITKIFKARAEIKGIDFVDVAKVEGGKAVGTVAKVDSASLFNVKKDVPIALIDDAVSQMPNSIRDGLSDAIDEVAMGGKNVAEEGGIFQTTKAGKGRVLLSPDLDATRVGHELMHGLLRNEKWILANKERLTRLINEVLPLYLPNRSVKFYDDVVKGLEKGQIPIDAQETLNRIMEFGVYTPRKLGDEATKLFSDIFGSSKAEGGKVSDVFSNPINFIDTAGDAARSGTMPYAAAAEDMEKIFKQLERGIEANWGRTRVVADNTAFEKALEDLEKVMLGRVAEARVIAGKVATEGRNFALHNYQGRTNIDTVLSLIYPYHFWHSRTYKNWLSRIATNPGVLAAYAKYKSALAEIHAGAPEWWRYNVNSNEMFGIFQDNPLFFNLESTLNPLYGITGVDFNDRYKRVDGFTGFMDDLNKFGPSLWTPLTLGIAVSMSMQGEDEAASRWAGRLIPQTKTLDAILSVFNIQKALNQYKLVREAGSRFQVLTHFWLSLVAVLIPTKDAELVMRWRSWLKRVLSPRTMLSKQLVHSRARYGMLLESVL